MSNKGGNILEKHVDKIILVIIGLISLFLLGRTFIFSPHKIEIRNDKLGPASIDEEVLENAQDLKAKVDVPAKQEKQDYPENKQTNKFKSFLENSLRDPNDLAVVVDKSMTIPLPAPASDAAAMKRVYEVPQLVELEDPEVNLYRGVAEVPLEKVDMEHPYESVSRQLEDVDLVTVQAEFDIEQLYENFKDSFAGRSVKNKWRDETLAVPVFARVELQRKVVRDDGSEGDWEVVPFSKVNKYKDLFDLPESLSEFNSSGLRTIYARLSAMEAKVELLQPGVYDFAYPGYQWIAPEFDKERQKIIERERDRERRASSPERPTVNRDNDRRRTRNTRDRDGGGGDMGGPGIGMPGMGAPGGAAPDRGRNTRRRREPERREIQPRRTEIDELVREKDPEGDFSEVVITSEMEVGLDELDKMVIWAHDDTAVSGKKYQYRMRLGIANPIAGVAGASWQQETEKADSLIFWTNFVKPKEAIEIPKRMYVFATDVKRWADKTVAIEVAKYNLGNWYKNEFILRPGDVIGEEIEIELETGFDNRVDDDPETKLVDFSTGSQLLDVIESTKWTGGGFLTPRTYYEVLYTSDAGEIVNTPANNRYWSAKAKSMYNEILEAVKNPVDISSSGGSRYSPTRDSAPGGMPGMMPGGMPGMPGMMP